MIAALAAAALLLQEAAAPKPPRADPVEAALRRATETLVADSTNGGWVGSWSLDGTERYGEADYEPAAATEIWVQPPGTPTVGATLLRAWRVTEDRFYLDAARGAGRALAWGQRRAGGWDHRVDVAHLTPEAARPERAVGSCTLDDDISQAALRFLMDLDAELDEPWLDEAVALGIEWLLAAQYEDGGWPKWYPLRGRYHDHRTFNDGAINRAIETLLDAHARYGREDCLAAALRGWDFVVASQLAPPRAGWAQQHDAALRPAPGRAFEPAAVCTAVTTRNLVTLLELFDRTGDARFLAPFPAAIDFLDGARLEGGRWPRFVDVETGRALFADRDGSIHHDVAALSEERRTGYAWFGQWDAPLLVTYFDVPLEELPAARARYPFFPGLPESLDHTDLWARYGAASEAMEALGADGRWVRDDRVHVEDWVRRARQLLDALELLR